MISKKTRGWVYVGSAIATLLLHFPLGLPPIQAIGFAIGSVLWAWGLPAVSLWLGTRKQDATTFRPYIAPAILWLIFFAAHVFSQMNP